MAQKALLIGNNPGPMASAVGCLGIEVEHLVDPAKALQELGRSRFGLVAYCSPSFSDELLNFCVALRRINRQVPLAVTAPDTAAEDRVLALEMGADDFLDPEASGIEQKARLTVLLRRAELVLRAFGGKSIDSWSSADDR